MLLVQSDPDLPGCSGERVLPDKSGCPVYRGQIPLISYIGGKFILPVNRGPTVQGKYSGFFKERLEVYLKLFYPKKESIIKSTIMSSFSVSPCLSTHWIITESEHRALFIGP